MVSNVREIFLERRKSKSKILVYIWRKVADERAGKTVDTGVNNRVEK